MNYIDFRAAVECLFRSDIIRTEKLYKIAVVLTIKIKKYLCTHCYCCSLPHNCNTVSVKMLKVWESLILKPITHNTWSLVSQRTGEWKRRKNKKKHTLFHNQPFSLWPFFFSMSRSTLSGNLRLQRHYSLFVFPCKKLNLKSFVFVAWVDSSYLFCSLHVGFFSIQCGCLARQLHTLQIQPEELHGYQLRGLRSCGESRV